MTNLGDKLELAENAQQNGGSPRKTIADLVEAQRDEIDRALPAAVSADRLVRVALTTLRTSPDLTECTPESFLGALMLSAQLGLEPGPLGHAYFVPRWNKNIKSKEVTFLLGYKGLIDLALRSERVETIEAHPVYETDEFAAEYGTDGFLRHTPNFRRREGDPWLYYCICKLRGGGHQWLALNRDDVDARRQRSSASGKGPWVTDYDAMARKSCVRALAPYLPLSIHAAQAIARDESVHTGIVTRDDLDNAAPIEAEAHEGEDEIVPDGTEEYAPDDPGRPFTDD
jgi:recombination protein RecT